MSSRDLKIVMRWEWKKMFRERGNSSAHVLLSHISQSHPKRQVGENLSGKKLTLRGLQSEKLHPTAQRRVPFPCTNSVTAQLLTPLSRSFCTMTDTLDSLPNMLVYQRTCVLRMRDCLIKDSIKATSPPGVIISTAAPVHACQCPSTPKPHYYKE